MVFTDPNIFVLNSMQNLLPFQEQAIVGKSRFDLQNVDKRVIFVLKCFRSLIKLVDLMMGRLSVEKMDVKYRKC